MSEKRQKQFERLVLVIRSIVIIPAILIGLNACSAYKLQNNDEVAESTLLNSSENNTEDTKVKKLKEKYSVKYSEEIHAGSTDFLNSPNAKFRAFKNDFISEVNRNWRYPIEAATKNVTGITVVKITFNRNSEITKVKLLESSGSKILDDEVFRSLRLCHTFSKYLIIHKMDEFSLIVFFEYGPQRNNSQSKNTAPR